MIDKYKYKYNWTNQGSGRVRTNIKTLNSMIHQYIKRYRINKGFGRVWRSPLCRCRKSGPIHTCACVHEIQKKELEHSQNFDVRHKEA